MLNVQRDKDSWRNGKVITELQVVVTASKKGSAWDAPTLGDVGSWESPGHHRTHGYLVLKALTSFKTSLAVQELKGCCWAGSKPSPLPGKEAGALELFIPQVPATRRCACAPRAPRRQPERVHTHACAVTHLAAGDSSLFGKGDGAGRDGGGARGRGRVCVC